MKQYLIRIVLVSEVSCKFSFVTFNMAPLLGLSFSFSDSISHQILTNIPPSMISTIFLSICRFISIFASVLFCKQSFKTVIKISSHQEHVHTSLPPCWLPLPFDSNYKLEGHNLFHQRTTITTSRLSFQASKMTKF